MDAENGVAPDPLGVVRPGAAPQHLSPLEVAVVLARVTVVIIIWLGVFLFAFLGYLTLPAVVLLVFLVTYGLFDAFRARRRRRSPGATAQTAPAAPEVDEARTEPELPR